MRLVAGGMQVVTIQGKYAYTWSGTPNLEVGEWVELPGFGSLVDWVGQVTAEGGDWEGGLMQVLRRWPEPEPPLY